VPSNILALNRSTLDLACPLIPPTRAALDAFALKWFVESTPQLAAPGRDAHGDAVREGYTGIGGVTRPKVLVLTNFDGYPQHEALLQSKQCYAVKHSYSFIADTSQALVRGRFELNQLLLLRKWASLFSWVLFLHDSTAIADSSVSVDDILSDAERRTSDGVSPDIVSVGDADGIADARAVLVATGKPHVLRWLDEYAESVLHNLSRPDLSTLRAVHLPFAPIDDSDAKLGPGCLLALAELALVGCKEGSPSPWTASTSFAKSCDGSSSEAASTLPQFNRKASEQCAPARDSDRLV
jgi:hypothetical protein